MMRIASEPISKNFVAPVFSRSFCISFLCYILVLIVPALILINISYSWPQYKRSLITPVFTYQGYSLSCLTDSGAVIYSTNLPSGLLSSSQTVSVGVGTQNHILSVSGQVVATDLKVCSIQVFLNAQLGKSVQALVNLPLNFQVTSQSLYLSSALVKGTASLKSSQPISQSSLLAVNETQMGIYPYSFASVFRDSGSKAVTLDSKILYNKADFKTSSTSLFTFTAQFQTVSEIYLQQTSLIQKLRVFIPIFMYLCLFMWWLIVDPLIEWMLVNKVYSAKVIPDKVKKQ